jgi:GTP cyclohydrolase IA
VTKVPETSYRHQIEKRTAPRGVPTGRPDAEVKATQSFFQIVWGSHRYDWASEHRRDTPKRFMSTLRELTHREPFEFTTFDASDNDEMIVVKDIKFVSLCAHHVIPFMGVCHIAYIPNREMAGLSKFARLVKWHSADLTVQENLTQAISDDLGRLLNPIGHAVVMEAEHMCMAIRGVQSPGTTTITSSMMGAFADHTRQARAEFLQLIGKGNK